MNRDRPMATRLMNARVTQGTPLRKILKMKQTDAV